MRRRFAAELRVFCGRPGGALRAGVAACIAAVAAAGLLSMDETLGLFDFRADHNASLSYLDREYGDRGWARPRHVIEDARLWMPDDARYAIELGPSWENLDGTVAADFIKYFLLPRREVETSSGAAEWAFCYACDRSRLPGTLEVLSRGPDGVVFGRLG